ncbi:chromosome replication/partitioning protein [Borreliella garinii]|uniref:chromosome replication/partitioning protein n=1 Tax=Borreliella garinii TaxID=29519 RepID=UPI00292EA6F7|nr:chromosome replication/partitioning protein [Borreliella garinii]WNZ73110.1 chromosome replication/partitioning protein [Borreliella garinii]
MSKDVIILNDRGEKLMGISEKEEYENYKHALKKSMVNDFENKIEIMEILYNIKNKKLYCIDGHVSFKAFIEEFLIARIQAYLYFKIYEQVLKGNLSIKEIRDKGMIKIYRNIKSKEVVDKKSMQNSIKPLRFQLKRQDSYDFYKSNAKFIGYLLDKIFSRDKDYLNKIFKEHSDLNLKKQIKTHK